MRLKNHLLSPLLSFFKTEAVGGILLLAVTVFTLIVVNSPLHHFYESLLHFPLIEKFTLHHFVNDALMVLFFYVVGLEIKRELLYGALSKPKDAALPLFAALGGMVAPALIYLAFNSNPETQHGWGIPMATDIAFAVGVITLFGKRIPLSLKAFLLAFAIIDDLGAILVIALFYSQEIQMSYLAVAAGVLLLIYLLQRAGVRKSMVLAPVVWFCFLKSGIHATIAGVILAFLVNARPDKNGNNPLELQIHFFHPWVAFFIMPVFAFFNAGVFLDGLNFGELIQHSVSQGIVLGLVAGKPLGIAIACFLAIRLGFSRLPRDVKWAHLWGAGCLGGIGFTMSLFIGSLAFTNPEFEMISKASILTASVISGVLGYMVLRISLKSQRTN